ncbi:hypothetical protein PCANC_22835 [Puccinia coronata f. sp. avenae]|uniref:Copper transport protein n=1 Tax=Puccinia coronata f. sp. avenae TaxID=200324 RepID=A0A2N5S8Q2_9BASI|nr:hypothetical protein PCANC_22835 [Puccinia coronata f. sp. avenae]
MASHTDTVHRPPPGSTSISRVKPSIAESIIRPQTLSANVFTSQPKQNLHTETAPLPPNAPQLPFSVPQLAALGLAMASSSLNSDDHQHHHHHQQHNMDHSSHGTPEAQAMSHCSMNMVFNSQPIGTCIVFRQFYVSGTMALLFYLTLLFVIAVGYEYLRLASNRFERMIQVKLSASPDPASINLINPKLASWGQICVPRSIQLTRSLFYISNVALSFFLMLVIMTYNAQIILAVLAGAFVGHFVFHREISFGQPDKGMACH